jgi:hypothetical protein
MDNVEETSNESPQKHNYNHWDALEMWRYLQKDAVSPDAFIDMGFLYLIAASLERRVWLGPKEKPLFPNLFVVLVAEPGVGKGQVVGPVTEFLKHHKEQPRSGGPASHVALTPELVEKQKHNHSLQQELIAEALASGTLDNKGLEKSNAAQPKQLFRMASDSITFEKLVNVHAKSLKVHEYLDETENKRKKYLHASIAFSLEEMSSLFKRKTEDVADYLLTAFDCKDYSYDTIGRGNDLVTRCCLNFFAGTTPGFLKKSFRGSLIEEGLSARITFVYEHGNRVNKYPKFNDLDATQKEYGAAILEHIRKLSTLYGRVHLEPDAEAYLNDYFSRAISEIRTNKNIKLIPWYARKNIHLPKFAMAVHFSRDLRMVLTLQDILDAESILCYLERNMHLALDFDGNNPLSGSIKNIIKFLRNHKTKAASRLEIWRAFVGDLRESDLDEALNYLVATNAVVVLDVKMPKGETIKMYTLT